MEEHSYSDPAEFPKFSRRRRCCGQGVRLMLVGLATILLWAGLLTLLLFWHWDTVQNLKQLEVTAARNVSRVAKDLERHNGDQMAQKAQDAQVSQSMEEIQAEQKRMKAQDSELSRSLDGLRSDLSNLKSLSLNERHTALRSLERLQEEVVKLWIELHTSNGESIVLPSLGSLCLSLLCPLWLSRESSARCPQPRPSQKTALARADKAGHLCSDGGDAGGHEGQGGRAAGCRKSRHSISAPLTWDRNLGVTALMSSPTLTLTLDFWFSTSGKSQLPQLAKKRGRLCAWCEGVQSPGTLCGCGNLNKKLACGPSGPTFALMDDLPIPTQSLVWPGV
ncbi:low affinity immunoglobulin epsilon Fc receptor isoform X2 [Mirounga leonina]|uniref:low affinity immunoglobulin epsilon Fc receptor isoform X2 n=1 Tax=Mirounga leonina TaxID=9715 RepID=UPI00156C5904|nr:low affinity immunoglobulin epsilon Fc receptor isoform X2 [Mirounga leonina]